MPYKRFRRRWRRPMRATRIASYVAMSGLGGAAMIWHPRVSVQEIGLSATYWWAMLVLIGGTGCLIGSLAGRYRVEWISLGPAIGGCTGYAITLWTLITAGGFAVGVTAASVTVLALLMLDRFFYLSAVADELRLEHAKNGNGEGGDSWITSDGSP